MAGKKIAKDIIDGQILSLEAFEQVASDLNLNWSERTLNVVRDLLVHDLKLSAVAEKYEMSAQQASVHRNRFQKAAKESAAKKLSAEDFMRKNPPALASQLEPLKKELLKLSRAKYSPEQIVTYLRSNNVDATEDDVSNFLKGL